MSLSSVGRMLNSCSDGPGSNFGVFNPRLALKQASKCWSHTEEIFVICHLAQLVERFTRVQLVRVQTSVDWILGWLWSKRPSVGLIPKKFFFMCHLAQIVERWIKVQMVRVQPSVGSILGWLWWKRPSVRLKTTNKFFICHLAQLVGRWTRVQKVRV